MHDVEPRPFTTVIREMIRHENDVTDHRIMWLLIGQGLIANAYVGAGSERPAVVSVLAPVAILVTLSTFVILYKSYHARGCLQFLGDEVQRGTLREEDLPLLGWRVKSIEGWRRRVWVCPWLGHAGDLLEPYLVLPSLLVLAWLSVLLLHQLTPGDGARLILCGILTAAILSTLCVVWVRWQEENELEPRTTN